jgi:hypothetical protein
MRIEKQQATKVFAIAGLGDINNKTRLDQFNKRLNAVADIGSIGIIIDDSLQRKVTL